VLLAELCVIQMSLDFCHNKSHNNIIYENDCSEIVEIFIAMLPCMTHATNVIVYENLILKYKKEI